MNFQPYEKTWRNFSYVRYDPAKFSIRNINPPYWFALESQRSMIPVEKLHHPFTGIRYWKLRVGLIAINWRW